MTAAKVVVVVIVGTAAFAAAQEPAPRDWVDPATGHRVVRLTDDRGGSTLYSTTTRSLPRVTS